MRTNVGLAAGTDGKGNRVKSRGLRKEEGWDRVSIEVVRGCASTETQARYVVGWHTVSDGVPRGGKGLLNI